MKFKWFNHEFLNLTINVNHESNILSYTKIIWIQTTLESHWIQCRFECESLDVCVCVCYSFRIDKHSPRCRAKLLQDAQRLPEHAGCEVQPAFLTWPPLLQLEGILLWKKKNPSTQESSCVTSSGKEIRYRLVASACVVVVSVCVCVCVFWPSVFVLVSGACLLSYI